MLGVPSLASRPDAVDLRGLRRGSSPARWGLNVPVRRSSPRGGLAGAPEPIELADDSVATARPPGDQSAIRLRAAAARSASSRRVALSSSPDRSRGACSVSRDMGRNAGVSSSSSSSSRRPALWVENFPNRLNLGALRLDSSSPEPDSEELDERSSSSSGGDRKNDAGGGWSRLVTDGRRAKFSHLCSLASAVGVWVREVSRGLRNWLTVVVDVELVRRPLGAAVCVRCFLVDVGAYEKIICKGMTASYLPRWGISFC